ncbi:MAG: 3'-5' exonuclease [Pelagibacteraceae bacterium]|nr:3'-5' exonuclease [Pelagibacteraceae bacterium]MCI5079880.1 3'-5' exonuclease [Pelagibacteraceae bacterium]
MRNIFSPIKKLINTEFVNKINISDVNFCVFDTETTGLNYNHGDKIISVSGVKVQNYEIDKQDKLDEFCDPMIEITPENEQIHHISNRMVKGKPNIYELESKFRGFFKKSVLVAHNVKFDCNFLISNLAHTQFESRIREAVKLDTVFFSAGVYPEFKNYELSELCNQLNITHHDQLRHSSLGDSIITARLFIHLLKKSKVQNIKEILNISKFGQKVLLNKTISN